LGPDRRRRAQVPATMQALGPLQRPAHELDVGALGGRRKEPRMTPGIRGTPRPGRPRVMGFSSLMRSPQLHALVEAGEPDRVIPTQRTHQPCRWCFRLSTQNGKQESFRARTVRSRRDRPVGSEPVWRRGATEAPRRSHSRFPLSVATSHQAIRVPPRPSMFVVPP
jgi:hypothetical protein